MERPLSESTVADTKIKNIQHSPQPEAFEETLKLQTLLINGLLTGSGPHALTHGMAMFMNCCVIVSDTGSSILADGFAQETTEEQKKLFRLFFQEFAAASDNSAKNSTKNDQSVSSTYDYAGLTFNRLSLKIQSGCEQLGSLDILRITDAFSNIEINTIKNAVSLFAIQLQQNKKIAEIELRLKGNFIEDLISTNFSDPDSIINRARALDYDISKKHRVLVAEIENLKQLTTRKNQDPSVVSRYKIEMIKSIQNRLDQSAKGMVTHHNDVIILLVQNVDQYSSINELKNLAEDIIQFVSDSFGAKLYIGIGSECLELTDYAKSFLSAKKSLEIGSYMITEGQVRSFEQFSVHALFLNTLKPADLYNYARNQLGALLDYDERHNTELVKTLQEFLYLRNNVEKTARTINMSISGLKYRLQKIEKIIGLKLQDYKISFDLQLALIILQLFGEYKI